MADSAALLPAPSAPSSAARRLPWWRGLATVAGVIVVVLGEFALLTGVYHVGDGARGRHQDYVGASSALAAWAPGADVAPVLRAYRPIDGDSDEGRALRAALTRWRENPATPARRQALRDATARYGTATAAQVRSAAWLVAGIHATLLVLASVGWFLWFRRVVQRHRELEGTLVRTQELMAGERRMTAMVRNSADLMAVIDPDGTLSFVSASVRGVMGLSPDYFLGKRFLDLLHGQDVATVTALFSAAPEGDHSVTLRATHHDGRPLVLEGTLTNLLADEAVGGWVFTARDVTERLRLQEELTHQALYDSLTGLANRRLFTDRLEHALCRRADDGGSAVVLFCDLDDFKDVNDTRGHQAGDQLLVAVAGRLGQVLRQSDTAARFGGDEFAVLMEDADLDSAREVAGRLLAALLEPTPCGEGESVPVRASIGIAVAAPDTTGQEVLRNADVAMYWAKDRGKGGVAVYDAELHASALARLQLQGELAEAIRDGQLRLHYQPNVDLATGAVLAVEALVRWQHPTRGLLVPGEFVPLAEQSGLIVPLDTWVLREACRAGAEQLTLGPRPPDVAVNITARQIAQPGFVSLVLDTVAETGLPPGRLKLEIIESTLLEDRELVVAKLIELRSHGIWVAVDDFGTGYSSLSYLADLPVDVLKIDKSFVDQVCDEGGALVDAIVRLADSLHLITVGEGIETAAQARRLREAGCAVGQGYLWSRPLSLPEIVALLGDELTVPRFRALVDDVMADAV